MEEGETYGTRMMMTDASVLSEMTTFRLVEWPEGELPPHPPYFPRTSLHPFRDEGMSERGVPAVFEQWLSSGPSLTRCCAGKIAFMAQTPPLPLPAVSFVTFGFAYENVSNGAFTDVAFGAPFLSRGGITLLGDRETPLPVGAKVSFLIEVKEETGEFWTVDTTFFLTDQVDNERGHLQVCQRARMPLRRDTRMSWLLGTGGSVAVKIDRMYNVMKAQDAASLSAAGAARRNLYLQ
jgi:hypothetical protein